MHSIDIKSLFILMTYIDASCYFYAFTDLLTSNWRAIQRSCHLDDQCTAI